MRKAYKMGLKTLFISKICACTVWSIETIIKVLNSVVIIKVTVHLSVKGRELNVPKSVM